MAGNARPRRDPGRVIVDDVARLAGVSTATVSRVVNRNASVRPEVREAVTRAIEQLGYVPNRAARSLMTRRTDSVGVVFLESAGRMFGDPFFGELMLGVSAGLSDRELQLVLLIAPTAHDEARVERYLAAGHVDGAVVVGPHGNDPLVRRLTGGRLPFVVQGRPLHGSPPSYVDADNRTGARLAVGHLIEGGRRTVATIHGTLDLASGLDRLEGYRDALFATGVTPDPTLEAAGDFSGPVAADAMRRLVARRPDLDAVFVASDSMAAAALQVLAEAGRSVPDDVAVVGFDDSPIALETRPQLTTVRQPIEAMGREMVRLLLHHVADPNGAAQQVIFGTELVVRGSSSGTVGRAA